ncbi:MAG: CDC48 family AAA ATPase [Candidatus Hermodarchaeia archaeon]
MPLFLFILWRLTVAEDQSPPGKSITLRVKKAHERDAGRFIVRIDSSTMEKLGVQTGDILGIKGRKQTAGIVWPAYPQDEGQSIIRMDGRMRRNAGVSLEENLSVYSVQERPGLSVTLAPLEMRFPVKDFDDFVKQKLLNCPVVKDDTVHVSILGRPVRFLVRRSRPTGVVLIALNTQITILSEPPKELDVGVPLITYEEIGGLNHEIQRIREMVELPLKHPELFARLGINPPKGVLLFGPPGCGKTLLAQAVANESEAHFISINGPEIMSKFYGESEKRLRQIFDEAEKNAPSIIFIDELDAIAPKREEVIGEVERRVVAQLLAVMDGLQQRGQVIVIGASNRPNAIDPALRRPGRFDREVEIRVPDKEGRHQILHIHSRGMPLESVKPESIADITHGFVGADLAALCREAAMNALRRYLPRINLEEDEIPPEVLADLRVTNDDFMEALREIQPTAMREVTIEVPNVRWSDVGGLEVIKHKLQQAVQWPLQNPESFTRLGVEPPRGVLLYGPPGCGKTLLARAVATESEANFISIKGPEVLSKWVGESEKAIREVFRRARHAAPAIIFFDEIDAIAPARGTGAGDSHVTERVISQFLTEIDGIQSLKDIVVLAATNRPDLLDPAMLRPGRFDRHILVPAPDEKARKQIFEIYTREMPITKDVKIDELVRLSENFAGSDIAACCREAALAALEESMDSSKVTRKHFLKAIEEINPTVTPEMEKAYLSWGKQAGQTRPSTSPFA